ncbi:MAG TPA: GTP-binding protein [Burkholderiaceae bacterium]|nr:GTP-binding protein [Burkholderiaceae bacterium]
MSGQDAPDMVARTVLNVLTGFLGSGKTTLLRRLLDSPELARCAIIVNELGEIPLDHELLERIDNETVVLRSGCICCGVRTDLAEALQTLTARRDAGEVPFFDRVVLETTGLADPVPVINTVLCDPVLRHHYRVGTVATTVDAVLGLAQLQQRPEARRQAAVADRLIITKADRVDAAVVAELQAALQDINAPAAVLVSRGDATEEQVGLSRDLSQQGRSEVEQWFWGRGGTSGGLFGGQKRLSPAHGCIRTVSLQWEAPLNWTAFGIWLSMYLHRYGSHTLRFKAILDLEGVDQPTIVHGVQHLLHPPEHLPAWPDGPRNSRLVFIGDLPPAHVLEASLAAFLSRASR